MKARMSFIGKLFALKEKQSLNNLNYENKIDNSVYALQSLFNILLFKIRMPLLSLYYYFLILINGTWFYFSSINEFGNEINFIYINISFTI